MAVVSTSLSDRPEAADVRPHRLPLFSGSRDHPCASEGDRGLAINLSFEGEAGPSLKICQPWEKPLRSILFRERRFGLRVTGPVLLVWPYGTKRGDESAGAGA